jgi:hypothetical protein
LATVNRTPSSGNVRYVGRKSTYRLTGPHKNGIGFDLVIPAGISISGRVVCVERKDEQLGE